MTCSVCCRSFETIPSKVRRRKTCGKECDRQRRSKEMLGNDRAVGHAPNATSFKRGHRTWNAGFKGRRFSPRTEFRKGLVPKNKLPVGSVTVRIDKEGHRRAWVKIAEPNRWKTRAVLEWEKRFGSVPRGAVVHHISRDTMNDSISNLALASRGGHITEHRPEFEEQRLAALRGRKRKSDNHP